MSVKLNVSVQNQDFLNIPLPNASKNSQMNSAPEISVGLYQHNQNQTRIEVKNKIVPNEKSHSIFKSINKFTSKIIKSFKKFIKGEERYNIEKTLLKMVENKNIENMPSLASPYDSNKFSKIVPTVSKMAMKHLQKEDSAEVEIKSSKDSFTFLFMKDKEGKIDVLVKSTLLGSGGSGDVYRAVSITKNKEYVLKYAKDNEDAKADLKFENRNLELLNHPGVQKKIKIAHLSRNKVDKVAAKGKIYSKGDLFNQVIIKQLSIALNISDKELLNLNKVELKDKLDKLVQNNNEIVVDAVYQLIGDKRMADFATESKRDSLLLDLAEACLKIDFIEPNTKISMAANLVGGLLHIHDQGMVHVDIKPKNFFFNKESAVIADFGGSRLKNDSKDDKFLTISMSYATLDYKMAMSKYCDLNDEENWFLAGKAYDQRSMGLSLYEIFTGRNLPSQKESAATYKEMKKHLIHEGVPSAAAKVIIKMCRAIPIDLENLPKLFPTFVTDEELRGLERALSLK